ncbi:MAG: NAD(P)-dependent alcohol dehydrogenase [Flammeovirgaceae bacterium]|nr:NAD(P)-dependent alcohol dehydrogenase [Flammeovirgaceae bacterium]
MKAIVYYNYGPPDVLKVQEVNKPIPKDNEVLIKVHNATVMPADCEMRRFQLHVLFWLPVRLYMGLFKPKRQVLGMEMAGEIEATGKNVTGFKKGDRVFGGTGLRFGAYAEYASLPTKFLAITPSECSHEEVVSLPTCGTNALHYLRLANIKPGEKILIIGAGGCFGTYAVQLAKYFGATVTAVDTADKLDTLRNIGANHVVDYRTEDFTKNGKTYDIIFDIPGKNSVIKNMKSLTKNGRYVLSNPWVLQVLQGFWGSITSNRKFFIALAAENPKDLDFLSGLIAQGKIKPVIDSRYQLEQMVEAHRYVEGGAKVGQVIINAVKP